MKLKSPVAEFGEHAIAQRKKSENQIIFFRRKKKQAVLETSCQEARSQGRNGHSKQSDRQVKKKRKIEVPENLGVKKSKYIRGDRKL